VARVASFLIVMLVAQGAASQETNVDPLPEGALYRLGTPRLAFPAWDEILEASPDGRYLAFVSHNRHLLIYAPATGRDVARIPLSRGRNLLVRFTPDGDRVLVSQENELALFDVATGKRQTSLGPAVRSAAFSADGKTLAIVRRGEKEGSLLVRRSALDGQWASEWTWESAAAREDDDVRVAAWLSPDGESVAVLESDYTGTQLKQNVRVYDARKGGLLQRWALAPPIVEELVFTPDGRHLAASSQDATVRVWEAATGKERARWRTDASADAHYPRFFLRFAGDGESLVCTGLGGLARWDWRAPKRLREYPNTRGPFAFVAAGKKLAAQGLLATLRCLDLDTGDPMPAPGPVSELAVSPDGRTLAWAVDNAIMLGDAASGREQRRWSAGPGDVLALAFSPDGRRLASASFDGRVRVWSVPDGKQLSAFAQAGVQRVQFTADGRRLVASAVRPVQSAVFDPATGERVEHFADWDAASVGGNVIAFLDPKTRIVHPWHGATGKLLPPVEGHLASVTQRYGTGVMGALGLPPRLSPDGRVLLVTGNLDGQAVKRSVPNYSALYLRDTATGRRLEPILAGDTFFLFQAIFSPDGRHLAILRGDGELVLVRVGKSGGVRRFGPLEWQLAGLWAFTPDGRTLIIASHGNLHFWEVATGGLMLSRKAPLDRVRDLTVAGDGRVLLTLSTDGVVHAWDLTRLASGATADALAESAAAKLWVELATVDPARGRQAVESLAGDPKAALAMFRQRLTPTLTPEAKKLAALIDGLDSDEFEVRQQSTLALERLGPLAGPAMQQALSRYPGLEARRRMEALVDKLERSAFPPEALRMVRAIQVLENIGTREARDFLVSLTKGDAGALLTDEAQAALRRLTSR
jgi:WD40 repeat protein